MASCLMPFPVPVLTRHQWRPWHSPGGDFKGNLQDISHWYVFENYKFVIRAIYSWGNWLKRYGLTRMTSNIHCSTGHSFEMRLELMKLIMQPLQNNTQQNRVHIAQYTELEIQWLLFSRWYFHLHFLQQMKMCEIRFQLQWSLFLRVR